MDAGTGAMHHYKQRTATQGIPNLQAGIAAIAREES
jgi:hypothetical protein